MAGEECCHDGKSQMFKFCGSLFMDIEDIPFEELLSLASDKSYWKALVAGL